MSEIGPGVYGRPGSTDLGTWVATWQVDPPPHHLPLLPAGAAVRSILDLGCNGGYTTIDLAGRFPEAQIVGVEIDAANARVALANAARFGARVSILHLAVWDADAELVEYGGDAPSTLSADRPAGKWTASVSVATLLELLPDRRCDFVKIDVEGAEQRVFRAADAWAERVGSIRADLHGWPADEAAALLRRVGFEVEVRWAESLWAWRPGWS